MEGTSERGGTVGRHKSNGNLLQGDTSVTQNHMDLDLLPMPEISKHCIIRVLKVLNQKATLCQTTYQYLQSVNSTAHTNPTALPLCSR